MNGFAGFTLSFLYVAPSKFFDYCIIIRLLTGLVGLPYTIMSKLSFAHLLLSIRRTSSEERFARNKKNVSKTFVFADYQREFRTTSCVNSAYGGIDRVYIAVKPKFHTYIFPPLLFADKSAGSQGDPATKGSISALECVKVSRNYTNIYA